MYGHACGRHIFALSLIGVNHVSLRQQVYELWGKYFPNYTKGRQPQYGTRRILQLWRTTLLCLIVPWAVIGNPDRKNEKKIRRHFSTVLYNGVGGRQGEAEEPNEQEHWKCEMSILMSGTERDVESSPPSLSVLPLKGSQGLHWTSIPFHLLEAEPSRNERRSHNQSISTS